MADADTGQLDLRTVFVKGVSFDWDDKDFEGALSNVGPLRKCFLLKGAGKNHKVKCRRSLAVLLLALPQASWRCLAWCQFGQYMS